MGGGEERGERREGKKRGRRGVGRQEASSPATSSEGGQQVQMSSERLLSDFTLTFTFELLYFRCFDHLNVVILEICEPLVLFRGE